MAIRAVVFDIGGVLEITPRTGWVEKWEVHLHLKPGELDERLRSVWRDGTLGYISEEEVEKSVGEIMGMDQGQVEALMADLWEEYLGELNVELAAYFASLRPRYQTAILSNSKAVARGKEQERYQFGEICDLLIYSHEEGIAKPERRIFELTCERLGVQPQRLSSLTTSSPTSLLPASLASRPSFSEKPKRPSLPSRLACKPHNLLSHALFAIRCVEMRTL